MTIVRVRRKLSRKKILLFSLILFVGLLLVSEALSWIGILVIGRRSREPIWSASHLYQEQARQIRKILADDPQRRFRLDAELGWTLLEGTALPGDQINARGVRSRREYEAVPPSGMLRAVAVGDSLTYCTFVTNEESWESRVEAGFPGIEVLNLGVPGYGSDQAYLRYQRDGRPFAPQVVILGFCPEDILRCVNRYRPFISVFNEPLGKPRFVVDGQGRLELLPNPLPTRADYERLLESMGSTRALGRRDYWYQPVVYENPLYQFSATFRLFSWVRWQAGKRSLDPNRVWDGYVINTRAEPFKVQSAIFREFAQTVADDGRIPLIVFFADRSDVTRGRQGQGSAYQPLIDVLRREKIAYVDTIETFLKQDASIDPGTWYVDGIHHTAEGNRLAAELIGRHLRELAPQAADAGKFRGSLLNSPPK